jgi:putative RNA 2'-phosphotransferase
MTNFKDLTSLSKFLSYVLRHHPEEIDLELDKNGWAEVQELLKKAEKWGKSLSRDTLEQVIQHGSKQRFILSEDGTHIRAGYGHSIDVDLELKSTSPPDELYHGTAKKNEPSIIAKGIHACNRNLVHLSASRYEARSVGSRHGSPVILVVKAKRMAQQGYDLYQSESEPDIWMTKKVPAEFVERL